MSSLLPPRWKDLESDERYGQLNATQRLGVFNKWLTDASAYGTKNKWWDDEKTTENFKGLVKTKLSELSQASFDENKVGGFEDVKDAATRAGAEILATPRRANQVASDVLLSASKAIDFVPGLVAEGLNKTFGTEFKIDSWLTNQLRKTSETNQARLDEINQKNQEIGGGELAELAGGLAAAASDAVVDVGSAMLSGGTSLPGTVARRAPGLVRGVLDDLAENFAGPSGRQLRIASSMGSGRSYSGTWNEAIRDYTNLGYSREEAEAKAAPEALNAGAATYLITMLGGRTGVESVLKNSGAQGLRGRVKEVLNESFAEGLEEGADQTLQDLNERFIRNPDKAVEDSYKEIKYAFGLGTLLGGGFSMVGQTVEKLRESGAPETADSLASKGWWEDSETTAQKLTEIKAQLDTDFGPDDDARVNEQIDLLEEEEGTDNQEEQTPAAEEQAPVPAVDGAIALPPQRMGVQTLPDDTETAPVVDESADVFSNVPRQQPPVTEDQPAEPAPDEQPQTPGRYTPEGLATLTDEELAADETELSLMVNREATAATQPSEGAFGQQQAQGLAEVSQEALNRVRAEQQRRAGATVTDQSAQPEQTPVPTPQPEPQRPAEPPVNVLPTGTDAALPPQRMAPQQLPDDTATAPVVDETGDVFSGVSAAAPTQPTAAAPESAGTQSAPESATPTPAPVNTTTTPATAPANTTPASLNTTPTSTPAPAPAPASALPAAPPPVAPAPTSDAQAFEDSLVEEARSAGTNVTGRSSLEIKEAIKGKGWYPKANINRVVAQIKDRVRQRREAEATTPAPALPQGPAPATPESTAQALPEPARKLIEENRSKGSVPTSATINARFGNAPVEQRQAIRREAVRQVAQDFGIAYSDDLDFNPDFDGNASIPIRVTATGTEPVFVNNPTVTAKQIDAGFAPIVPENQRASVAQGIEFDPDTGRVTSAFARGVTVTSPGQLESAIKAQRPGSTLNPVRALTTEADIKRASSAVKKFNKTEETEFSSAQRQFQNMRATSPSIEAAFGQADLVAKAESIWAHERAKDKQRPRDKRKNYTPAQVWNFTMEKAAERLKTMPRQESLDAPVSETGTMTRGETLAGEADTDAETGEESRGTFAAAAEEADAIEEGVARDEVTEGGVANQRRSGTGMTYTQAFNIANNPRILADAPPGEATDNLRAEAQELLAAAEPLIETLDNDDIDYWNFKIEDFQNVDVGNPGTIISSSRQAKSPYIDQQRSWFEDVARAMGVRRASALTPEQHGTLARYFAEKYRLFFEDGNTTLPVDAVGQDLPELQARMAATDGAASEYRAVIDKLKAEFPGARVIFSASQNATAWYHPRYRDTIFVNPLLLEQELDGLTDSEATPFIRALMQEEYIHMVESQNIPREWVMAIGQRLDGRVRQRVLDEYVPTDMFEDPAERQAVIDGLDDYAIGSEYLRMLMQRMQSGRSTEDLSPQNLPQDILQRIMEMLRAVVRRLRAQLEVARDPVLAHTIRAIEAGTRKLAIQAEVDQLSPQDRATLVDDLATARDLFARPRAATTQSKPQAPNHAEEAAKVKPGKSYWINADGRVIDVVAEDTDGKSATHGRYVRNWVDARIGKFFPGASEKEVAQRIETRARELMTQDPSLREELDQEAIELAYQEAVDLAEVLGQPVPDIDDFRADAARRLGPSDMAYNEAAIEAGWARVAVPGKFSAEAPIQVQTRKGVVSPRTNNTINELKSFRNVSLVEDGAISNKAVNRSDVGRMLAFIRSLPEPPTGPRFARPGNRIRGRAVGAPVRGKGGLWSNIKAIVTGDFSATKSQTGGWFSSGKLTPFERDIVQKPRQKIASEAASTEFTIQEFRRAIKAAYGKGPVPTELINRALGSTENPLTDTQMAELRKIRNKEEREAKKAEFKSLNRDAARADRATALGELPPKVAAALSRMRDKIDSLSRRMIEGGYIPDTLVPVFDENMDIYLHREYLIFQNPEWKENMLNPRTEEQARIRAAAERLFVDRAMAEEAVRLRRIAKEQGQPISKDEAKKRAKASTDVIARRANDLAVEYLSVADENSRMFFMGTTPPGKRNLSIIKVRGQIPKEVRAFWGEINDAETNFTQTVAKMSAFMAQHDAATELLQHGIENNYIWKRDHDNRSVFNGETRKWDVILAGQRQTGFATKEDAEKWRLAELPKVQEQLQSVVAPAGYVHLIKKGTVNPKAIEPLNDAYGPPELADALAQLVSPRESSGFYRGISFLTAMFMAMKTIGYFPQAFVRNFLSNPFGQLISGGINVQNWGKMSAALREGTRVARLNTGLRGAMDKVGSTQELREKLLRLGVLNDNPRGTMLKDLYEKGIESQTLQELLERKDFKTFGEKIGVKTLQTANKVFQKMADIYQGIDDIWKAYGWLMEVENQRRAHPDWAPERIEQKAAEQIRDMVWTYSMSPEVTKGVRRIPVLAPFITWTSEVIRATSNAVAIANEEIRVGKETGNKAMYRNGINRRAGQFAAFTALPALAMAMRAMLGYDEEDEEAVRSMLPDWQKNAQIVLLGQSDEGKQVFVDLSYLDPLQVFKEPAIATIRAIRAGDNPFDVAAAGFTESLKPVFSEQLFAGAMFDISRNQTAEGRRIWNPTDTASNKTTAMLWHVIEKGGPGLVVGTLPRIYKAATGTVSPSGRSFNLGAELGAPITGQRIQELDAQTSLRQAVSRFKTRDADSTQLLSNYMTSRGTVDPADISGAYDNANRAKREAFEELAKIYNASLRLGTPENIARQTLMGMGRDSGLSREDAVMIIQGVYRNWRPSRQMYDLTVTRDGGRERIRALMDHLREVNQQQRN
jgi:hypothetical protein